MTLIAGYIYREDIHIFADSASTSIYDDDDELNLLKSKSSFGEIPIIRQNELIEESDQKIYNYSDQIILTFSGDVESGTNVLKDLQDLFSDPESSISEIILEYFTTANPSEVSFIIGFYEDNKSQMFAYKSPNNYQLSTEDTAFIVFGSGSEINDLVSPMKISIIGFIKEHKPTSEELNVAIVSILQSSSMVSRTLDKGVGGFFNGSYLFNGKVHWSPDVIYLSCSRKLFRKFPVEIIFKYNILDSVFVSSESGAYIHLPESFWFKDKIKLLDEDLRKMIIRKREDCQSEYFSIISYDKIGSIIIKRGIEDEKNHIKLKYIEGKGINYNISSYIETNITTPPINPITEELDDSLKTVKLLYLKQSD